MRAAGMSRGAPRAPVPAPLLRGPHPSKPPLIRGFTCENFPKTRHRVPFSKAPRAYFLAIKRFYPSTL
ncbi:hypothetical protein GCM10019016_028290 [Streptomyces prasinosporus]|uniref:Uncharacterized protein n=1 Tax=Streptomyces prasinosporus TaxID=68256 RepID=A0ABP6TLV2_9ACTN